MSPNQVLVKVVQQVWKLVAHGLADTAIRRISVDWITVDWPTTLDADDAIWCEYDERTKISRVYVTITDVAEVIPQYSPMDLEALVRSTTLYLHPVVIPMLPETLSNDLYSLNGKRKHIALTVEFDVDALWNIIHSNIYESMLQVHKTYTHDGFSDDAKNPDADNYKQIQGLFRVVSLLNKNRWSNIWAHGIEEMGWQKPLSTTEWKNVHEMIATLMVMANQIVAGKLISHGDLWVFRQHLDKKERAFYSRMQGKHEWLWIYSPNGYTHFTSPLRRYADMIVHRILKAKKRWENVPYDNESLDIILSHVNRRILEVETILNERKWSEIVKRISRRSGWRPRTHDLKEHLKRWAKPDEYYTIPQAIRECIIEDISDDDSRTWQWAIGVILLWNDYGLKEILFRRITQEKHISPWAFLRILSQTRLIIGSGTIFTLYEQTDANFCIANITLPNGKVLSSQKKSWKKWEINEIRGHVRRALMYKVFRHYMQW
jgi:hypothetical protein